MLITSFITTFPPSPLTHLPFPSAATSELDEVGETLPCILTDASSAALFAFREFFEGVVENEHTRRAYRRAVMKFLGECESGGLTLQSIAPWHVSRYIRELRTALGSPASVRTRKLHLAAIRQFFDVLVTRHVVPLNPALSVKGPRLKEDGGATPAISAHQIRQVFAVLEEEVRDGDVVALRDRSILGVLAYTGARSGAVAKLCHTDYYTDGTQRYLRFHEKNGKIRHIPVRYDLQTWIDAYLAAMKVENCGTEQPLFPASDGRKRGLTDRSLGGSTVLRIVQRRVRHAGLPPKIFTGHSYRAAVATNLLEQGVPLPDVQFLLGHSDPRTTQGYDRSGREVTRNVVERISF